MGKSIFWNRRSGQDRRDKTAYENRYLRSGDGDRRVMDRRLYGDNDYLLIIGHTGIDRFTLLVTLPVLAVAIATLVLSWVVRFS